MRETCLAAALVDLTLRLIYCRAPEPCCRYGTSGQMSPRWSCRQLPGAAAQPAQGGCRRQRLLWWLGGIVDHGSEWQEAGSDRAWGTRTFMDAHVRDALVHHFEDLIESLTAFDKFDNIAIGVFHHGDRRPRSDLRFSPGKFNLLRV